MRAKKEIIKLDTVIIGVVKLQVYVCELDNGHQMVAVADGRRAPGMRIPGLQVGDRVELAVCPGDMTRGWVVRKIGSDCAE